MQHKMAKALVPIIDIADDACEFAGDTLRKHKRFMAKQAARAFKNINMFINQDVSVGRYECAAASSIEMPKEFVYETKVGLRYKGRVIYLGRNRELTIDNER